MIAYKGMCPGMICLGYQLKMGLNVTEQANCQANGFHCAANPMDCLRYYGDFQNSEYYLVRPCGDLDEDAVDSRISCTQLWVLRKLEPQEFFLHALAYMADHPQMPDGCDVKRERAQAWNGYAVVRGKHPRAKGKIGDILAFAREAMNAGLYIRLHDSQSPGPRRNFCRIHVYGMYPTAQVCRQFLRQRGRVFYEAAKA